MLAKPAATLPAAADLPGGTVYEPKLLTGFRRLSVVRQEPVSGRVVGIWPVLKD